MNQAQIDCQQLRIKHILFKSKVRSVLYGGNYDGAFFSSAGPVSSWFSTIGFVRYQDVPELKKLGKLQQEIDGMVRHLVSLYQGGKIEEAHEGFRELENRSEEFLDVLSRMESKMAALI
ncbi:histidine kinase [Pontibacter akesuensis]|uniref:Uncharacterized protein n=1 Tax=Pontibacter akesuensis TaxID=388950 RepID=A0A1I7GUJ7_9BACT|nr:histidine kinase [Pontibacter akesuensis]GHA54980.1 hypothetical protein GCM10007389_02920 [Pontibacter akesuensis]SFU52127.1 hypothetical protein SAMN04487941_1283 [Pontibacter akesuensis]